MKYIIIFLLTSLFSFACSEKKIAISDLAWLQGKWIGSSDGLNFFEEWQPLQGNVLEGRGGGVSGLDTVFSEKIKIEQRGADLFYVPSVTENGGPVDFKFVENKADSLVFENLKHDFPQRVVYFRLPGDKLYACIDGLEAGKYKRIEFSYQKVH